MKQSLGLYIHVPFCLKKCFYCDFCSFPGRGEDTMKAYTMELCRRMKAWSAQCGDFLVDTVYFGGGTPTLLPLSCFEMLTSCIREHYALTEDCEITCECNPATADFAYLKGLRRLGINRLSIGLQSTHDEELRRIGRAHSYSEFLQTFSEANDAGFDNISVDLMYGLPDQTVSVFEESLARVASLSPAHISAYGLKIEEGTAFFERRDALVLPDEESEARMYELCGEVLGAQGYRKYEISNFCKEGRRSRHNLRYWKGLDYLGFGVAAHSFFRGVRFGNSRNLSDFLAGKEIVCERTELTEADRNDEYIMLGLRLAEGLDEEEFVRRFGMTPQERYPSLKQWIDGGLMCAANGRLFFTDRGFFVSNAILSELLDFA